MSYYTLASNLFTLGHLSPFLDQFTILPLSFVTFRVSRFPVSYLTHETVRLGLQNTLNMSKMTRVYFGVLHACLKLGILVRPVFENILLLACLKHGLIIQNHCLL